MWTTCNSALGGDPTATLLIPIRREGFLITSNSIPHLPICWLYIPRVESGFDIQKLCQIRCPKQKTTPLGRLIFPSDLKRALPYNVKWERRIFKANSHMSGTKSKANFLPEEDLKYITSVVSLYSIPHAGKLGDRSLHPISVLCPWRKHHMIRIYYSCCCWESNTCFIIVEAYDPLVPSTWNLSLSPTVKREAGVASPMPTLPVE